MITSPLLSMVADWQSWSPAPPICWPQSTVPSAALILATTMSWRLPVTHDDVVVSKPSCLVDCATTLSAWPQTTNAFWPGFETIVVRLPLPMSTMCSLIGVT